MSALSTLCRKLNVIKMHFPVDIAFSPASIFNDVCKEHKTRCLYQFVSSLSLFLSEYSQFSQLKCWGKTTTLSAIQSRVFFVENLLFKYLVVMTCNYATSGPNRERERQSIQSEMGAGCRWNPLCFVGYFKRGSISKY